MNTLKTVAANIFDLEKDRAPLEEIAERIYSGGTLKGTNMCILILAIFIASIGLNMNSTAVIIGAMLISPLMGVIMSLGYGMATYDSAYVRESFLKLVFQVSLSVLTSAVYFTLSPIDTASTELLARTEPTIWDVLIAIFGGLAGIIGSTRIEKSNVIPGVAIASAGFSLCWACSSSCPACIWPTRASATIWNRLKSKPISKAISSRETRRSSPFI